MADRAAEKEAARRGLTAAQVWQERADAYPAKRVLSAEEIAEVIAFLASDAASGVNGEAMTVSLGSLW
jgi:NAD(P)-dependent dehydrogenase (short-subunit alcohol dehydrogenase family)